MKYFTSIYQNLEFSGTGVKNGSYLSEILQIWEDIFELYNFEIIWVGSWQFGNIRKKTEHFEVLSCGSKNFGVILIFDS